MNDLYAYVNGPWLATHVIPEDRGVDGTFHKLRDDAEVGRWVHTLVNELGAIRERSWYREKDFRAHRRVVGGDCWVTDILEGDYYLDGERYDLALDRYRSAADRYPRNPWPFLRMGKGFFCAC